MGRRCRRTTGEVATLVSSEGGLIVLRFALVRRCLATTLPLLGVLTTAPSAGAGVVVLANRGEERVAFTAVVDGGVPRQVDLAAGDSRPLFGSRSVAVRTSEGAGARAVPLEPDCAYSVSWDAAHAWPTVNKIDLGETAPRAWPPPAAAPLELPGAGDIPVKILVDENEVRPQNIWEPVLRARIAAASEVLRAHAGITLRVVAVGTWNSDDNEQDFFRSLGEFEREVLPAPARLAIGFSSQYAIMKGRVHLGGTRGPLHSHILIKERATNVLETERLELLVHELGHYLGASHSPAKNSVMRPVLNGGLQRAAGAHVQFDPANTLLMSLMGQEMRQRRVQQLSEVSAATRRRMSEIYGILGSELPDDPAAAHYLTLMASAGGKPLADDARRVLVQIMRVAKLQEKQTDHAKTGDELFELYVRQAALAAKQVRRENGPRAFLLALGAATDDGPLGKLPIAATVLNYIEGQSGRTDRLAIARQPTIRESAALARQFCASGFIVALAGSEAARSASTVRELAGVGAGGEVDFATAAADRAGIALAHNLIGGRISLDDVAARFTIAGVLPPNAVLQRQLGLVPAGAEPRLTNLEAQLGQLEVCLTNLPMYQGDPAP